MNKNLISFVIPLKDEEQTITALFDGIVTEVKRLDRELQVIFVDDGSTDKSWSIISMLAQQHPQLVHGIRFRRNLGKAAALAAGFKAAKGAIVFTMDADLQDDPKEIGRFLEKLDEGFDLVSGWKRTRHDPWHKVLPSRVFNKMLSRASGVRLHDHNCGFKCYRAAVVRELNVYGEMHRMLPSLAGIRGFKSTEIEVEHHPRRFGQSKYGVKRFLRGFMDMTTVWFLRQYRERPLHLLGGVAVTTLTLGGALFAGSFLFSGTAASQFAVLGTCMATAAIPLMATGFLAELIISRRNLPDSKLPVLEEVPSANLPPIVSVENSFAEWPLTTESQNPVDDEMPLVLISDDDPNARRLMAYHLQKIGFRVTHAGTGPETIEKMSSRPTVVVLDLMLPGMDGLQCLQHIRKVSADTKVIMVSAHGQIRSAVGAMKLGAYDYIAKPFEPAQFVGAVFRAVQQQNLMAEHIAVAA